MAQQNHPLTAAERRAASSILGRPIFTARPSPQQNGLVRLYDESGLELTFSSLQQVRWHRNASGLSSLAANHITV